MIKCLFQTEELTCRDHILCKTAPRLSTY